MAFVIPMFTAAASAVGSLFGAGAAAAPAAAATTAAAGFSWSQMLGFGGALVSGLGTVAQGMAASQAADYNAAVQRQQAQIEQNKGIAAANQQALDRRQKLAGIRAGAAQSGFEAEGSIDDLLDTANKTGVLAEMTALYDGSLRARGLRMSAELNQAQSKNALFGGVLGGGASILSGFSKAYLG